MDRWLISIYFDDGHHIATSSDALYNLSDSITAAIGDRTGVSSIIIR